MRIAVVQTRDGVELIPTGLDFAAVLARGSAMGCDAALLAEVLPGVETAILARDDNG